MPLEKGWAKTYARRFEELAKEFLATQLGVKSDEIILTPSSHDGGVDVIHEEKRIDSRYMKSTNVTFCEAKLRSSRKRGIELSVVGKCVMVAFNRAANTLVLVTNCRFLPEALEHAALFEFKSNLKLRLIDGPTLSGWVRRNKRRLQKQFAPALLDALLWPAEDESRHAQEVTISARARVTEGVAVTVGRRSFRVVTGWTNEGMAACAVEPAPSEPAANREGETVDDELLVIEEERERLRDGIFVALRRDAGIAVVQGAAGVGKSTLLESVRHHLASQGISPVEIDLRDATSDRVLFARVLSALTGIDVVLAARAENSKESLAEILAFTGGVPTPPKQRRAVAAILSDSFRSPVADVDQALVTDYICDIAATARVPTVLMFSGCDRATPEVLDTAVMLAERVSRHGTGFVFELRSLGDALPAICSRTEWETFVRRTQRIANLGTFTVEPFSDSEAIEYLNRLLPRLGKDRAAVVVNRVGRIPLYLRSAAEWLRRNEIVSGDHAVVIEHAERYFESISPDDAVAVLDLHIDAWWTAGYQTMLAASVVLDGRLSIDAVRVLALSQNAVAIMSDLIATRLFEPDPSHPAAIRVVHALLHDRLSIRAEQEPFARYDAARALLPKVAELFPDEAVRDTKLPAILASAGEWEQAFVAARKAAGQLADRRQWTASSRLSELAFDALQHLDRGLGDRIDTLADLLESEDERYRLALSHNARRLQSLVTATALFATTATDGEGVIRSRARALALQWRFDFTQEHFAEAFQAASELVELVKHHSDVLDTETAGAAFGYYGITLKAMGRRRDSLDWFEEAAMIVPDSTALRLQRLSNIAAFHLATSPREARIAIREILTPVNDAESGIRLEQLHAHVDLAMIDFLDDQYGIAATEASQAVQMSIRYDVPAQEARARNILGCARWALGQTAAAAEQFDGACFAAERMLSNRFLWRMRTNHAGTALELGDRDAALTYSRSAERLVLLGRTDEIAAIDPGSAPRMRWYAALVAIGSYYGRLRRSELFSLSATIGLARFGEDVDRIMNGDFSTFAGTTHVHGGRIMITG